MTETKLNPAAERDNRRETLRKADITRLQGYLGSKFDWAERYDKKYILKFARDYDFLASRLQRAIDSIDLKERLAINKELNKEK